MGRHGSGRWGLLRERLRRWGLIVTGPIAVLVLIMTVPDYAVSVKAWHNEGLLGTFTIESSDCSGRGPCTERGTFVSDDDSVRRTDVFIDSGEGDEGDSVPAQWLGDKYQKVYELDSHELVWLILIDLAALGWLAGWVWLFVVMPSRRPGRRG